MSECLASIAIWLCSDAVHAQEWARRPADTAPLAASLVAGLCALSAMLPSLATTLPPEHHESQAALLWAEVERLAGALSLLGGLEQAPEQWPCDADARLLPSVAALLECSVGAGSAEQAAAHEALRGLQSRLQG